MVEEATVFVPGHVTGFFTVERHEDPLESGSRGAGLVLSNGVEVTVRRAPETTVTLDDDVIEMPPVETVLRNLGATATVDASADVPLGAGFGVSGAMALGTALATNRVFERELSRNELISIAHGAEVQAGTGLGDVVAQAAGGIPIRLEPGAPGHGLLDAIPAQVRVEYVAFDRLDTGAVIEEDTDVITEAGQRALSNVVAEPTLASFVFASRRFAREAGLLTNRMIRTIRDVSDAGGEASMAMLGETVFAFGTGLSDAGYDAESCVIDPCGARFV